MEVRPQRRTQDGGKGSKAHSKGSRVRKRITQGMRAQRRTQNGDEGSKAHSKGVEASKAHSKGADVVGRPLLAAPPLSFKSMQVAELWASYCAKAGKEV